MLIDYLYKGEANIVVLGNRCVCHCDRAICHLCSQLRAELVKHGPRAFMCIGEFFVTFIVCCECLMADLHYFSVLIQSSWTNAIAFQSSPLRNENNLHWINNDRVRLDFRSTLMKIVHQSIFYQDFIFLLIRKAL